MKSFLKVVGLIMVSLLLCVGALGAADEVNKEQERFQTWMQSEMDKAMVPGTEAYQSWVTGLREEKHFTLKKIKPTITILAFQQTMEAGLKVTMMAVELRLDLYCINEGGELMTVIVQRQILIKVLGDELGPDTQVSMQAVGEYVNIVDGWDGVRAI